MSDFVKRLNLKDCSVNTLISYVPEIINNNNKEVIRIFNDIFEFGTNENRNAQYIKTPINTKGVVRGNSGIFNNISASHITLDSSSLANDFLEVSVKHQNCPDRFKLKISSSDKDASTKIDTINSFAHDAENIFYDYQYSNDNSIITNLSVKDYLNILTKQIKDVSTFSNENNNKINALDASIKELYTMLENIVSNLNITKEVTTNDNENENLVEAYNNPPKSYTYLAENYKK